VAAIALWRKPRRRITYPVKPIRIVVGFCARRALRQSLAVSHQDGRDLGQQLVNRETNRAAGRIATEAVGGPIPPYGYTILNAPPPRVTRPSTRNLKHKVVDGLIAVFGPRGAPINRQCAVWCILPGRENASPALSALAKIEARRNSLRHRPAGLRHPSC